MAVDEGSGAAVQDRNFRPVDLDQHVVDTEAGKRGHQMFDRRDGARSAIADDGAQFGRGNSQMPRIDQTIPATGKTSPKKNNAMIRFSRMKNDLAPHLPNERRHL